MDRHCLSQQQPVKKLLTILALVLCVLGARADLLTGIPITNSIHATTNYLVVVNGAGVANSEWLISPSNLVNVLQAETVRVLANTVGFKEEFFWDASEENGWKKGGGAWSLAGNSLGFSFGDTSHRGVIRMRTTATGVASLYNSADAIVLGSGAVGWEWIVKKDNLPTAAEGFKELVGFGDTPTAFEQVDGQYFFCDTNSANWRTVTVSNSVATTNDTGVAVGTDWVRLSCTNNAAGSSAVFYIAGTPVATNTTTIPIGTARSLGFLYLMDRTVGSTERNHYFDAFEYRETLTTPR